jgi:ketosteroid isomerase-like protein
MIQSISAILIFVGMVNSFPAVDAIQEIVDIDAKLNKLIIQNNADEAASFYTDDFILITSGGKIIYKNDIVAQIGSADLKLEINETTDVKVRVHGTTAVLTGVLHQKGSYKGKSFDAKLYVTDTWIKTERGWKILSGQAGSAFRLFNDVSILN